MIDTTFDLFVDLGANDEQCDFPIVYASGDMSAALLLPRGAGFVEGPPLQLTAPAATTTLPILAAQHAARQLFGSSSRRREVPGRITGRGLGARWWQTWAWAAGGTGAQGVAGDDPDGMSDSLEPLFECIVREVAPPSVRLESPLQMLVTNLDCEQGPPTAPPASAGFVGNCTPG